MALFARGSPSNATDRIADVLASAAPDRARQIKTWIAIGGAGLLLALALWYWFSNGDGKYDYRTATVRTTDLVVKVSATGTLEPVKQVEVGTEVSGIVSAVLVEENQRVKAGQILAQLDPERLQAERTQAQSALVSAGARLAEAQASVVEARENYSKLTRLHELSEGLTPSQQELQAARATRDRAQAQETVARASIEEAKARLAVAEINVQRTVIRSPINGIVLQREVEPGQTVAASLSTPVLFLLAENLTQLVLNVAVNEADIGRVRAGQAATFAVDAFPDREFPARIVRVRFAPDTNENSTETVVTYETTLLVNNGELLLRPGMTATADIVVEKHPGVEVIPNAALRFEPPVSTEAQDSGRGGGILGRLLPRRPRTKQDASAQDRQIRNSGRRLWILRDKQLVGAWVKVGASDGADTIVLDMSPLPADAQIVVDMSRRQD
jgi:HlyD family secretion protein